MAIYRVELNPDGGDTLNPDGSPTVHCVNGLPRALELAQSMLISAVVDCHSLDQTVTIREHTSDLLIGRYELGHLDD